MVKAVRNWQATTLVASSMRSHVWYTMVNVFVRPVLRQCATLLHCKIHEYLYIELQQIDINETTTITTTTANFLYHKHQAVAVGCHSNSSMTTKESFWDRSLTHPPLDKMAAVSQTIFSAAFSLMKSFVFWLKFHRGLFLRVQLTTPQPWFI